MNKENLPNLLNPSNVKSYSPVSFNYSTQTTMSGTLTKEQVDREQGIKVLGICAGTAAVLGGIFMICKAFGNNN